MLLRPVVGLLEARLMLLSQMRRRKEDLLGATVSVRFRQDIIVHKRGILTDGLPRLLWSCRLGALVRWRWIVLGPPRR